MNVLVIGHACGPEMGSEPGFTWNTAQQLSKDHRVWVITHPQFRSKVDAWMTRYPNTNLEFMWVDVESRFDRWDPAQGESGIHLHYVMWLKRAYLVAQQMCAKIAFDVAHHVSWGTLRAAPPLWDLPVPSVWGPLGGGQCCPLPFLSYFGVHAWKEVLRELSTQLICYTTRFRKAVPAAGIILATNRETQALLLRVPGCRVKLQMDCALPSDWTSDAPFIRERSETFTMLWAGRLEHRKALRLGLEAIARADMPSIRLVVAGTGALRMELEQLVRKLGLMEQVTFLGAVPYTDMRVLFRNCDAFLFTSLRDSFGSVVLEAMSQGLPVIALDHQGVGAFVPTEASIKVAVTKPSETIADLAAGIRRMAELPPSVYQEMQWAAWDFARAKTWDVRASELRDLYENVISTGRTELAEKSATAVPSSVGSRRL